MRWVKWVLVTVVPVAAVEVAGAAAGAVAAVRCPAVAVPVPGPEPAVASVVAAPAVDLRPEFPWAAAPLARELALLRARLLQAMCVLHPVRLGPHKTIATRARESVLAAV